MNKDMQEKIIQDINQFAKVRKSQAVLNSILEEAWNMVKCIPAETCTAGNESVKSKQPSRKAKKKTKFRPLFQVALAPIFSSAVNNNNQDYSRNKKNSNKMNGRRLPLMKSPKDVFNRWRY